jgi:phage terminase large subunit-like protein
MNIADCCQWVICFPEVTILILTGVYKLASDFVGELKMHFTLEGEGDGVPTYKQKYSPRNMMDPKTGDWTKSAFQVLFPEHCISPTEGSQFEFQTPVGGDAREPSVRAASIEQALSGMHFGVLKLDDVVHNENSGTMDRLDKINKQIDVNNAMLHPHGFNDVIGTWYDEFDYYGSTIRNQETTAREGGMPEAIQGSVDTGKYNCDLNSFRVYLRAAWYPKEESKGKIEEQMKASDYDLWFPEGLSYEFLVRKRRQSADGFAIKYLNNPRKIHRIKFPRELLISRTIPHEQMPMQGIIVTAVDTAYSTKQWADYTVAITAVIFGGRFYILNMVRGRFNEYELPAILANIAFKWKPKRMAIEDSVGVKWMGRELRREMDKLQISVPVEYVNLGYGSKLRSKQLKAKPVLRLLGDERMFFRNSCEGLSEIYDELEKFTGTSDDKHDDIVSALSLLAEQFGAYAEMEQKISYASTQYTADRQSKDRHDLIYGLGKYARYNSGEMGDHPATMFQVENSPITEVDIDPLSDLF